MRGLESRIGKLESNPPKLRTDIQLEDPAVELSRILHKLFTTEFGREMSASEFTALCQRLEEHEWNPDELLRLIRSAGDEPFCRRYIRRLRSVFAVYRNVREEIESPGFRVDRIGRETLGRALKETGYVMGWPMSTDELGAAEERYDDKSFSQGAGVDPVEFLVYVCSRVDLDFDTFRRECL
jgi:hypothetical protein